MIPVPRPIRSSRRDPRRSTSIPTRPAPTASSSRSVLLGAAAAAGVRLLALTDHDTLAGCRDVLASGAVPDGLELITGVEINAVVDRQDLWESELHILGFGMDPADDEFESILAAQRARRRERFERTVARLRELELSIDEPLAELDLRDDDALGRPTIARALVAAGHATSVEDAFQRLVGRGSPRTCRVPGSARSVRSRPSGRPAGLPPWPISARRCRTATCSGS